MRAAMAWILVASLGSAAVARGDEGRRPDIVVFLADDLGWRDVMPIGQGAARTPNLARLAGAGMTFDHAFVASPSCAPSRAALLTGLDPMRNGAMLNHARPRADIKKWPAYFRDLGYETVSFGKTAHYAQVTEYGFDHASHFKYHEDDCIAAAVRWLAARKSDKPLCLLVGTNWPHVPWPAEVRDRADLDVAPPSTLVDTPATRRARSRYLAAVENADRDLGLVLDAVKQHLRPDTLVAFSGDHGSQFPFGKWNDYDAGIRTPLVVAWPGHVAPGSRSDAMVSWIDLLPTCLDAAGSAPMPAAGLDGRSFLGVLLGRATTHRDRVFVTHSADGQMNRYPIRAVRTRQFKYIRNLDPAAEHHTHVDKAAAGDGKAYFDSWVRKATDDPRAAAVLDRYYHRPAEELYDVTADPTEQRNLVADPAHAETLRALRADLDAWMDRTGDRGLATERDLHRTATTKKDQS